MVFGIGERVREARARKGWTQQQLSASSQIHYIGISRIERGVVTPATDTLVRLADSLGCSVDFLLGRAKK